MLRLSALSGARRRARRDPTATPPDPLHLLVHALWLLWLIVAGIGAVKLAAELYRLRRLKRAGIFEIDGMSGAVFEQRGPTKGGARLG